jgi:hypothetical protein
MQVVHLVVTFSSMAQPESSLQRDILMTGSYSVREVTSYGYGSVCR